MPWGIRVAEGEVMEAAGQSASRPPRRSCAASGPRFKVLEVKLQQADQEEWFKTMQELQRYVLKGTEFLKHNNIIPEKEYLKFRMSILEREFAKGILEARDTKEDCLAFTRFLTNINSSDQARFQ